MNILIVGGLGYVGGRFAAHLKKQYPNYAIHLTTRKKTRPSWVSSHFEIHELDLMQTTSINQCLSDLYPEVVFHLGALQQADCEANPQLAHKINVEGTRRLVEDCENHRVKKYVYLSTFQVYGDFKGIITEETPPLPKSVYAKTKFEGEQIIQQSSMKTLILRLSNAYGYPMDMEVPAGIWTLAFNAFIKAVLTDKKIKIQSNQFRDFISLEDVCRAMEHLTFNTEHQRGREVINVGGNECLSIKQVAERVVQVYGEMHPSERIPIEVPINSEIFKPFRYQTERLMATGFQLHGFRKNEIIKTFELFRDSLKKKI